MIIQNLDLQKLPSLTHTNTYNFRLGRCVDVIGILNSVSLFVLQTIKAKFLLALFMRCLLVSNMTLRNPKGTDIQLTWYFLLPDCQLHFNLLRKINLWTCCRFWMSEPPGNTPITLGLHGYRDSLRGGGVLRFHNAPNVLYRMLLERHVADCATSGAWKWSA